MHHCQGDGFTETFTVSFFGHRQISDACRIETALEEQIRRLLRERAYVEFLVGRNGAFDQLVSSTIRRVQRSYRDDNSSLCLVLPYATVEYMQNQASFESYYDRIEISEEAAHAHPKAAIRIRNRNMVARADLIVCCIERNGGGAFQTVNYARKLGKPLLNLGHGDG